MSNQPSDPSQQAAPTEEQNPSANEGGAVDSTPHPEEAKRPEEAQSPEGASAPEGSAAPEGTASPAEASAAEAGQVSPASGAAEASTVSETSNTSSDAQVADGTSVDTSSAVEGDAKKKISIGSQRGGDGQEQAPAMPKAVRAAAEAPVSLPKSEVDEGGATDAVPERVSAKGTVPKAEPVPVPSKRQATDDIEQQLAAELGGSTIDDVINKSGAEAASAEDIEVQGRYKGTVARVDEENVFFTLKGRHEGVAAVRQFKKPPEVGAMLDVVVKSYNEEDGIYEVALPGASVSVDDWSDLEVGSVVEARVTGSNTGGLECVVNNIRGFIPASQIAVHRVENLGDYVNKKLSCVVTEAKPKRKNLVLSHRKVLEKELAEVRKETMAKLTPGSIVEGKVTRLREFGAFVDIGGVEGLVHISKLSWERIDKPEEVLQEGQAVKVKIEKVNSENGKISLSYRDTITHPWEGIEGKYPVDSVVKGTVSRLAQFGAFVRLEPGIEGLIHISELAHHRVVAVKNVVTEGDEVEVKVLSVDRDKQKMGLSLKATTPAPERKTREQDDVPEESNRELAVRKRRRPLKGGMDRPSGGESVGLNW